jgi:putative ABC transport system permease protein
MGANVPHIIGLVLKDYLVLMGIALVIATPVAYWFLNEWLSSFTFRISLNPIVFVIAFIGIAVVSFLTVISRVLRLAKSNPVNSLKYE